MRASFFPVVGLVALSSLLTLSSAVAGPLPGDTVTCASSFTPAFSCSAATAAVGPGVKFNLVAGAHVLSANFDGLDLILTDTDASNQSFRVTFGANPITISFADLTNAFTSATLFSSTASFFPAANVSFANGTLGINVAGVTFQGGSTVDIRFASAAVPEPESIALFGIGLLAAVATYRRRRLAA